MTPITKNLLSTKEASTWSGYHTDYIARLAKSGKISATRIGRSWLIDQESLAAFIESQEKRKKELSEILSRERIEEYQALTETGPLRPLREKALQRTYLKKTSLLSFSSHSFALIVALFVVGSGMYLAGSGVLEKMIMGYGAELVAQATSTHERIVKTIASLALIVPPADQSVATMKTKEVVAVTITPITLPGIYVSKQNSKLPTINSYDATTTNISRASFEMLTTEISLAGRRTFETVSSSSALSSTTDVAFSNARRAYLGHLTTLGTSLSSLGVVLRDGGTVAPSAVIATGNSIHSSVVAASESILEQYKNAIYTWTEETPSLPHKTAGALLTLGLRVKNIVLEAPDTIAMFYEKGTYSFVLGSYHIVDTVTETERTLAENTLEKAQSTVAPGTIFLGTVIAQETSAPHARFVAGSLDAFLPQGSNQLVSVSHTKVSALFETTKSATASLFGTKNVQLAVTTESFVPFVVYGGEETALFTYHTINELFRSTYNSIATIAGLFTPQKIAIIPAVLFPDSVVSDSNTTAPSSSTSTVQTVIGTGGSLIQKITNYYSTIGGITNSYLEQRLAEVSRDIVIQILDRRGGQGGGGPVDLTHIDGSTITNSTFSGTSVTTTNLVATNASTTNATTTNLVAINASSTNGTTTNFFATNATNTNIYATNATFGNIYATILNLPDLIATNATTTNATSTNFFSTNASITNFVANLATVTDIIATNATTTNLVATNATSTNFFATNGTITNFLSTLATITGLNVTNSTTTNATSTNFFATNGTVSNLFSTLATITGLTTTNATSTNLAISSLTQGRVPFVGVGGLLIDSANLLFDGVTLTTTNFFATNSTTTNATSTNLFSTNGTILNLFSTLATITDLNVTNSTTTNATSTNLFATNGTISNLLSTLATITGLNATNSTTTNATTTNLFATNGTITNFLSTLATITGLTTTNATTTNLVATNATTTNLAISSLAQGRVPFVGVGGLLIDSANLLFDGITLTTNSLVATNATTTNATTTNLFATNGTISNLFSTLATITGLNVINSTTTNATSTNLFSTNGSITNFLSTLATITGLNVTNSTTTNATSTNAFVTNLSATNATSTTFVAINSSTTNATSTNFFSTNGSITNFLSTLATITGLTVTNSTSTNATTTNFFATNSTISNLFSTLATITGLNVTNSTTTNATSTNLFASNGSFSNLFSTLATITGLNVTNSTTTNATSTNLFSTNGSITNFLSTLATITGLNVTNSTTTNATSTNLFSTNGTITNLTTNTVISSNSSTTNSTTTNLFATNATTTNFYSTNGTIVNFFSTLASTTALSVSNLTNGRVTYAGIGGVLQDSANLTFNGTTLTANTLNLTNALGIAYGGTGTTTQYTNGVNYYDGSKITSGGGFVFTGTNVGIGTTTPGAALDIAGGTNATGQLHIGTVGQGGLIDFTRPVGGDNGFAKVGFITNANAVFGISNASGSGELRFNQSSATSPVGITFYTANTERVRIDGSGNVGIGSTSPSAKLVVAGQTIGQYFTATSTTNTNTFPLASTTALTNSTALYNTYLTTNRVPYTTTAGLLTDSANLTFNGTTLTTNTLNLTNALGIAYGGTATTTQTTNGVNFYNGTSITSNSGFVYTGTNVGIGTSTPLSPLSVSGTGQLAYFGDTPANSYISFSAVSNSVGRAMFGFNNVTGNAVVQGAGAKGIEFNVNGSSFASGQAAVITSAGNFGIGTTSPAAKLEVFSSGEALRIGNDTNTNTYLGIANNVGVGPRAFLGYNATAFGSDTGFVELQGGTTKGIGLGVNNTSFGVTPTLYINASGLVGIGSTSPSAKLVVAGQTIGQYFTATSTTNSNTFPLASTTAATHTSAQYNTYLTTNRVPYTTTSGLLTDSSNLTFDGTTLTANTLNLTNALGIAYGGTGTTTQTTNGVNYFDGTSITSGSGFVYTGGNVGIGTSTPSAKLVVAGNQINTGYIFAGTAGLVPLNTTSGDITGSRLSIGNASTFSGVGTGNIADIEGTVTSTGAVVAAPVNITETVTPAADSSMQVRTFVVSTQPNSSFQINSITGGLFENRYRGTGATVSLTGLSANALVTDSTSVNFSTITTAKGINVNGYSKPSGSVTGSVTNMYGIYVNNPDSGLTVTSAAGITVEAQTRGTNHTDVLLGTATIPSGTFGIYNASTNTNYFAGNVGIGTTTPSVALETFGAIRSGANVPILQLYDNNAAADEHLANISSNAGNFTFQFINDSGTGGGATLSLDRSGNNMTGLTMTQAGVAKNYFANNGSSYFTNNLGIGSTSPSAKLVVAGQTIGQYFTATSTTNTNTFPLASTTALTNSTALYNTYLTTNRVPYTTTSGLLTDSSNLTFDGTTLTTNTLNLTNALGIAYGGTATTTQTTNGVNFYNGSAITSNSGFVYTGGNVGIGTTTPGALLDLSRNTSATAGSGLALRLGAVSTNAAWGFRLDTNSNLVLDRNFSNTWSQAFTFDRSSGELGIGTSSPSSMLHISDVRPVITLEDFDTTIVSGDSIAGFNWLSDDSDTGATGSVGKIELLAESTFAASSAPSALVFSTNTGAAGNVTERLRITSAGSVGIGTSTPISANSLTGTLLQLGGSTSNSYGNLILSGNATTGQRLGDISFQGNGGGVFYEGARIESNVTNGSSGNATLAFFTSSSLNAPVERMRITATGNVGIGSTSPSSKLVVVGETLAQYFTATSTTNANTFPLASTTALTNTSALYNTYLTSGRVPYTTTAGLLTDSANMTFNGTTFNVSGVISNQNITLGNDSNGAIEVKGTTPGVSSPYIDFGDSVASDYDWRLEQNTAGNIFSIYSSANSNILTLSKTTGNIGIGDNSPTALLTVGSGDLFQVNSSGAIAAATGITSSGTINFSGLTASKVVFTDGSKNLTSTGTVGIAQGGTNAGSQVTNGVNYYDGTSITSGSSLIFDGTNLRVNGAAATALFNVGGTYTTSNINAIAFGTTLASNATTQQVGVNQNISFAPTGGDVTSLYGTINISRFPAGSANITTLYNHYSRVDTVAGYTGTIATAYDYAAGTPTLSGSNPVGTFVGYQLATVTNGNGTTSGSISNYGVLINAITAAAGSGGSVDNRGVYIGVPSGNTSGTNNYGLYINGAGGTSATNNYSVYNLSTADSYFAGKIGIGTTTPTYALTVGAAGVGTGILVNSTSASAASPVVSVIGRRDSTNGQQAFGGGLALAKWSSGTASTLNERLGSIYFGGSYDGTLSGINYAASLSGVVETSFTATTSMSTGLAFYTGSSGTTLGVTAGTPYGTERLRITAGGNVGIGTSTPTALLQLAGTGVGGSRLWINNRSSGESAFDNSSNGLELTSGGMNTSSKYTPFIKFGSNDTDFATSSPQFFAAIGGRSLETYGGTTNSGMAIDFLATTTAVGYGVTGAIPTLTTQFTIDPTNLATRPILQINGDNNTGIYQTAADMFSITAGGVERIHIDGTASAGLIGLGTSTPDVALQVTTAAASSANGQNVLKLNALHQSATVGSGARLVFAGGSANSYAEESAIRSYTFGSNNIGLAFETGAGGPNVKMSLTGAGLLGLGTTTPNHLLEMYATSTGTTLTANTIPGIAITNADTTTNNFAELSFLTADSNGSAFAAGKIASVFTSHSAAAVSGDLAFLTRNAGTFSEKMRILANGNVGIGSTSPNARLTVKGAGTTTGINFQTTNSSDTALFSILDSGNVGIGTTTPSTLLTIDTSTDGNGITFASSGIAVGTIAKNSTVGGVKGLAIDASATTRPVSIGGQVASNVLLAAAGGNVGVGTTSVAAKLDIYGGNTVAGLSNVGLSVANGGDRLFFGAPSTGNPYIGVENSSSLRFFNGTTQTMTLTSAGNLGIGSTSPSSLLAVAGTSTLRNIIPDGAYTGNMSAYNVGASNARWNAMWAGTYNVGTSTWSISATGTDRFGIFNAASAGGSEYLSILTASGNVGIGTTNPQATLDVNGSVYLSGRPALATDGTHTYVKAGTSGGIYFQPNNAAITAVSILSGGNVGIGTSTPSSKLSVAGDATYAGNAQLVIFGSTSPAKQLLIGFDTTSDYGFIQPVTQGSAYKNLLLNQSGGNVGIGTTTAPLYTLSVNSSTGINTYDGVAGKGRLIFGDPADNTGYIGIYRSTLSTIGTAGNGLTLGAIDGIAFTTPGSNALSAQTERVRITAAGSVGIGSSAPLSKLDVSSTASAGDLSAITLSGNNASSAQKAYATLTGTVELNSAGNESGGFRFNVLGNGSTRKVIEFSGTPANGSDYLAFFTNNGTERMRILSGGNVAIGTSSADAKLQVVGGNLWVGPSYGGGSAYDTGNRTLQVGAWTGTPAITLARHGVETFTASVLSNGDTALANAGGTRITLQTSTGNVGIGTTTPGQTLTVAGNLQLTGALYDSTASAGTAGYILQSTGSATTWVATSTLGVTASAGGSNTQIQYNNSGALAGSSGFVFSGNNVGIGTSTPGFRLVVGAASSAAAPATSGVTDTSQLANFYATNVGSGGYGLGIGVSNSTGASWLQSRKTDDFSTNTSLLLNPNGGNVGIGTTTPTLGTLEVDGTGVINTSSVTAFTVGSNGLTTPAFQVSASTTSMVTGLQVVSKAAASGLTLQTTSSGANEAVTLASKGTGSLNLTVNASNKIVAASASVTYANVVNHSFSSFTASNTAATVRFSVANAADAALTTAVEAPHTYFNLGTNTRTHAAGAITLQRDFRITGTTHAFASASTITDEAAFSVDGPASAGTNATITNAHGIYVPGVALTGTITNSYGLTVKASSGATNNYAAVFTGGNVGIGTATPSLGLLTVSNSTDATNAYFQIAANTGGSATGVVVNDDRGFSGVNSGTSFNVNSRNDGINDTGAIASFTTTGGSSQNVLWVGINGHVGIGTASPSATAQLDVAGSAAISNTNAGIYPTSYQPEATLYLSEVGTSQLPWIQFHATGFQEAFMRLATSSRTFEFGDNQGNGVGLAILNNAGTSRAVSLSGNSLSYFNGGSLGVGTTTPVNLLDIATVQNAPTVFSIYNNNSSSAALSAIYLNNGTNKGIIAQTGTGWSGSYFANGTTSAQQMNIGTQASGVLTLGTANTARLTIESGGNIGIGTSTPRSLLEVNGDIRTNGNLIASTGATGASGSCSTGPGLVVVYQSGIVISCTSTPSDQRLKTVTGSLDGETSLEKISALSTIYYKWNATALAAYPNAGFDDTTNQLGFLAQNVKSVFPEAVTQQSNGYFQVDYSRMTVALASGISALTVRLDDIATTSDFETGSYAARFWDALTHRLITWFADTTNGIGDVFAKKVNTGELCVSATDGSQTCITKTQLDQLLAGAGASGSTSNGGSGGTSGGTTGGTAPENQNGQDGAPTVTLNGSAAMNLTQGDTFTDPGATATDAEDGDMTSYITVGGSVDTGTAGTYTLTYSVLDSAGHYAEVSRMIVVQSVSSGSAPDGGTSTPDSGTTGGDQTPVSADPGSEPTGGEPVTP